MLHRYLVVAVLALVVALAGCAGYQNAPSDAPPPPPPPPAAKVKVTSLDQLPQHSYPVMGTASELFADDAAFATFAAAVRRDLETDLARFDLEDAATLKGWYGSLANLAMLDQRWDDAIGYLDRQTALEEKDSARITGGQVGRALIAAHRAIGPDPAPEALRAEFQRELMERVVTWPWDVVKDVVEQRKGQAQYLTPNVILGIVQAQFDPVVAKQGALGSDLARRLVGMKSAERQILPLQQELLAVYTNYIDANRVIGVNIWPERDVALPPGKDLQPVMIGIWDSGVDMDVFGDRVFVNTGERRDGTDTDGNGFVDDVHGIAFDVDGVYSTALLHPEDETAGQVDELRETSRGFQELRADVDSPAATAVRERMTSMAPEEMKTFMTGLSFYGMYAHGTHVAGISLAGNPYARALGARITFDYHNPPQPMTHEIATNHADSYRRTARYFADHGVRVVNMSWGWTFKEIEASLESGGIGADAEERAKMAREMLDIMAAGLRDAMSSTPQILYCVAAGNSDSDVEFDVTIPANFGLDNMIVVGAVDQAGDPTDFTSGGEDVVVYANGFEVESDVPGGHRLSMSGTSMASPQVCNLAGKLLALDPDLDPAGLIRLIEQGADPHPKHPQLRRLDPRRSLAAVNEE